MIAVYQRISAYTELHELCNDGGMSSCIYSCWWSDFISHKGAKSRTIKAPSANRAVTLEI